METTKQVILPALTLRAMSVLPGMIVHFDVSREKSVHALDQALTSDQQVFLVTQKDAQEDNPQPQDLYHAGTISEIKNVARLPHGLVRVMVEGKRRAVLQTLSLNEEGDYMVACVNVDESSEPTAENKVERAAMLRGLRDLFSLYAQTLNGRISSELVRQVSENDDLESAMQLVASNMSLTWEQKQQLLEGEKLYDRFETLSSLLASEIQIERLKGEIARKVKARVDKSQKDYYLREQLKVIEEELGEELPVAEAEQYRQKLETLECSDQIREKIGKEITRFKGLGGASAEAAVSRTYIETLLSMPWDKHSQDSTDLKKAAKILDEDHYGLQKVKERVLEFLAVRELTHKGDSPILCLAGPPGTGKTSIARSVARALGKKYVRISLGGIHDEAEIRGHRRTYIGAMPGRIINGIRQAGVNNPLMLLDEIDKLGTSFNGDPSSALLEVLDSEQNCHFSDHYIELPTDLSEVLFIATANDLSTVPRPLLDRMEIIEVSSYTENEKFHIAKEHLVPKQREHHGLDKKQLTFTDKALREMISGYTREAGVRALERRIGQVCRKAAREILEADGPEGKKSTGHVRVTGKNLEHYLGRQEYFVQPRNEQDQIGIVRGLAWTAVGGVTLEIEVNTMPGKGELMLTGQLGDVMKESARAALTYVRSVGGQYGVEESFFAEHDIHIHIPEGAVPKDGPSAGITMATALLSACALIPVRSDTAMTGEISLRGRVMPIGGLKEKLLAAKTAGMKTVIVPKENQKDVEEISDEITGGLSIVYASQMKEVLRTALSDKGGQKTQE